MPNIISTTLIRAIREKNLEEIHNLLVNKVNINECLWNGHNSLTLSLIYNVAIVEKLIDLNADVNQACGKQCWNSLMVAAKAGNFIAVQKITPKIFKIDCVTTEGLTALMIAAKNGHANIVDYLIKAGADINIFYMRNKTALYYAVRHNHATVVLVLLTMSGIMQLKNIQYALLLAIQQKQDDIFDLLFSAYQTRQDKCVDFYEHMLCEAVKYANVAICQLMLNRQVGICYIGCDGLNALQIAARYSYSDIVELFKSRVRIGYFSGQPSSIDHRQELLFYAAKHGCINIFHEMQCALKDCEFTNCQGITLLMQACIYGQLNVIKYLKGLGANIEDASKQKLTPLMITIIHGIYPEHVEVVKFLCENGANPNYKEQCYGYTPLLLSSLRGNLGIVKVLLEHNAIINEYSKDFFSPLSLAIASHNNNIFDLLVSHGAYLQLLAECKNSQSNICRPLTAAIIFNNKYAFDTLITANVAVNYIMKGTYEYIEINDEAIFSMFEVYQGIYSFLVRSRQLYKHEYLLGSIEATPLLLSAVFQADDMILSLLSKKARVCYRVHDKNYNYFMIYIISGKMYGRFILTAMKYSINFMDKGMPFAPLMFAIINGRNNIVSFLLEKKVSPNLIAKDNNKTTSLCLAIMCGQEKIVNNLLENKAEVNLANYDGTTPLLCAVKQNNLAIVDNILKYLYKTPNMIFHVYYDALLVAAQREHIDMVNLMLTNHKNNISCYFSYNLVMGLYKIFLDRKSEFIVKVMKGMPQSTSHKILENLLSLQRYREYLLVGSVLNGNDMLDDFSSVTSNMQDHKVLCNHFSHFVQKKYFLDSSVLFFTESYFNKEDFCYYKSYVYEKLRLYQKPWEIDCIIHEQNKLQFFFLLNNFVEGTFVYQVNFLHPTSKVLVFSGKHGYIANPQKNLMKLMKTLRNNYLRSQMLVKIMQHYQLGPAMVKHICRLAC